MKSQKKSRPGAKGDLRKPKPPAAMSRKDKRKKERMEKKQRKQHFLMKKFGKIKDTVKEDEVKKPEGAKDVTEKKKPKATQSSESRALKQQAASRRKQLVQDNRREDQNIRKLEKMLKLNKRKTKTGLPKSFSEDGLDFILDACDSEKLELLKDEFQEHEMEEESGSDSDQPQSDSEDQESNDQSDEERVSDNDEAEADVADSAEEQESVGQEYADEEEEDSELEDEEATEEEEDDIDDDDQDEDEAERAGNVEGGGEWEDIYGRKRDASGNVLQAQTQAKYIPPALRAKAADEEGKRKEALLKLQRKAKGLLNRLSSSNIGSIAKEVEDLYQRHSRSDMNESLIQLLTDSLVAPVLTPERLVMEHAMLIGIMHVNIGMEVGASIIQTFVQQFHNLHSSRNSMAEEGKELDNYLQIISHLYAFKVIDAELILDILTSLAESFTPKDIELILLVLKATGFALRKDDPARLKSAILKIQEQSSRSSKEYENDSRTKFMLEVLVAIKNNNVKKIPNYDQEHLQMLQKNLRQFYRPDHSSFPLKIGLEDLVNADARGKWWLVGSAWAGNAKGPAANNRKKQMSASTSAGTKEASYSSDLMELARKMRMNTDTRKNIFCAILSAEDYLEAFEIVTKLNVPVHKEREVAFVLVDSCMNEKSFNPFYAHLLSKLCQFDRKYMIAAKFAIWDKIKDMHSLKKFRLENLAKFVSLMISLDSLGLSSLKVIEFADMDATCVRFLKIVLTDLLSHETSQRRKIFKSISSHAKLRILREGLGLFLRHFMLKDLDQKEKERFGAIIEEADGAMMAGEGKLLL